jgi:hypothetical protein
MSHRHRLLLAACAFAALSPRPASAVELAAGGYGLETYADGPAANDAAGLVPGPVEAGSAVVLDFTPRGGLIASGRSDDQPRLRLELDIAGGTVDPNDPLAEGPTTRPSWLVDPQGRLGALSVGGALRWSDWSLGGGLARTALFGGEADLMSASVGYRSLTASLSYGQAQRSDLAPLGVLMLSTDLAASSWLKLESNLAVGSDRESDSVAVGRVGIRLNF